MSSTKRNVAHGNAIQRRQLQDIAGFTELRLSDTETMDRKLKLL